MSMFIFPGQEIEDGIIAEMTKYRRNGWTFGQFCGDYGWQDWMNAYTDAAEDEPISDKESADIDGYLEGLWNNLEDYRVIWVGGDRDGEEVGRFDRRKDADDFADEFGAEHEDEFNPTWGGLMILNIDGERVD